MSPEFELIAKYFTRPVKNATLGVGDDCALISVSPGCALAISTDTLVCHTHFFVDADPEKLGHKAEAKKAYTEAKKFTRARSSRPKGDSFWSPAEKASEHLARL